MKGQRRTVPQSVRFLYLGPCQGFKGFTPVAV